MGMTQSMFLQAAADGNVRTVREMLRREPRLLHVADESGWTALHTASSNGHVLVVRELLQQGACVYQKDSSGFTALHYACWNDDSAAGSAALEVANELIIGGADVNAQSSAGGVTPLHLAVTYSRKATVHALLNRHGAHTDCTTTDQGNTPLHVACKEGLLEMVQILLEHDKAALLNCKNRSGDTPLHLACANSHGSVVIYLLEQRGIDIQAVNHSGQLPFSSRAGLVEMLGQFVGQTVLALLSNHPQLTKYDLLLWEDGQPPQDDEDEEEEEESSSEEELALEEFQNALMSYVDNNNNTTATVQAAS